MYSVCSLEFVKKFKQTLVDVLLTFQKKNRCWGKTPLAPLGVGVGGVGI